MAKLKVRELLDASEALRKLGGKPLSGLISYKVSRLMRSVREPVAAFEEAREKLLRDVGEKGPRPGEFKVKDSEMERWNTELNAILDEEVEIAVPVELSVSDFDRYEIEPAIFFALDWAIQPPKV